MPLDRYSLIMASPTRLVARRGGPIPVSLGPVGGGWVVGVADLVALTGAFLYPVAQMWALAADVTESPGGGRRRTTTSSSATSGLAWDEPEEDDEWMAEMEDAGFGSNAGPVMREELRVGELKKWEISARRVRAMRTRTTEEVRTNHEGPPAITAVSLSRLPR